MGAISGLLLAPLAAPMWGFRFLIEQLCEEADARMNDEGRGFADLIDLSMQHSAGKLSDAEFAQMEAEVLERLASIREQKEELLRLQSGSDDEWDGEDEGEHWEEYEVVEGEDQ